MNAALHTESFHVIGLTGYAGTGKDTARMILQEAHGFTGLAFADPIRSMLQQLLHSNGISLDYMRDRALKEADIPDLGVSYRQLAQTLGTEWGRSLQPDFWLRIARARIEAGTWSGESHFVISDVRFENEAAWLRAHGGVVWRIVRPGVAPVRPHVSEQEIDRIQADQVILNDGSIDALGRAIGYALRKLP